jgi:hypothetical protein
MKSIFETIAAVDDVFFCPITQAGAFLWAERSNNAGRSTEDQGTGRDLHARCNEAVGSDETLGTHHRSV